MARVIKKFAKCVAVNAHRPFADACDSPFAARCGPGLEEVVMAVPMVVPVVLTVLMMMAVPIIVPNRWTAVRWCLRKFVAVRRHLAQTLRAEEVGREPGGNGGENAGERPGNGQDRVREGV